MNPELWEAEERVKNAEIEIARLRAHRDNLAREVSELRLKNQSAHYFIEQLQNELAMLRGTK